MKKKVILIVGDTTRKLPSEVRQLVLNVYSLQLPDSTDADRLESSSSA